MYKIENIINITIGGGGVVVGGRIILEMYVIMIYYQYLLLEYCQYHMLPISIDKFTYTYR